MRSQTYAYSAVDPIIFTDDKRIVLALRGPDAGVETGKWHIPGGLIKKGETIKDSLVRHARAKTNLDIDFLYSDLDGSWVGNYDNPKRDSRYHDIAQVYLCRVIGGQMKPGPHMTDVKSFYPREIQQLSVGFDHKKILNDAIAKLVELGFYKAKD